MSSASAARPASMLAELDLRARRRARTTRVNSRATLPGPPTAGRPRRRRGRATPAARAASCTACDGDRVDGGVGQRRAARSSRCAAARGRARRASRTARPAAAPRSRRRPRSRRGRRARSAVSRDGARQHAVAGPGTSGRPPGPSEMRPRCGLRPTRPQHAAGMRDRAAAVVAVGDRHHARRDRGGRAAGRPARACATGPTGCASAPKRAARSSGRMPALGQRSWSRRSRSPRPSARATHVVVVGRDEVAGEEFERERQPPARDGAVVLDRDRARRRTGAGRRARSSSASAQRVLGEDVDERVERRVELVDAVAARPGRARARTARPTRTRAASSWTGRNMRSAPAAVDMARTPTPRPARGPTRNRMTA